MGSNKTVGDYVNLQRGITYKGKLVGEPGPALLGLGAEKSLTANSNKPSPILKSPLWSICG